jgi:molybdopterin-synthase adenylyltransferase
MDTHSLERYARQIVSPLIGESGQCRLLESDVVIVGCGATGSFIANALARAGVGRLRLLDRDFVELNNLQRQTLYTERDVREQLPKAVAARQHLSDVNSQITIEAQVVDVHAGNVEALLAGATLVMDGTDNLETRYLLNDVCVKGSVPWVYCAAVASYGMSMLIAPGTTACLRCLFPQAPPPGSMATCDTAGVLGPAVEAIAAVASRTAIRYLVGALDLESAGLTHLDLWELEFQTFRTRRRAGEAGCPCCARRRFEYLEAEAASHSARLCGRNAVQITPGREVEINLETLASRLQAIGRVTRNTHLLRLSVNGYELTVFPDARAIVQGTEDAGVARSLYTRYVGL